MQANSELVNSTFELASIGRHSKQGLKPSVRIERLGLGVVWGRLQRTLLPESLRSFLVGKEEVFLPLPDLSRKIKRDSVRRVVATPAGLFRGWRLAGGG